MRNYGSDFTSLGEILAEEDDKKKHKKYLHMDNFIEFLVYIIGFLVICFLLGLLFALPTMWLLNWLVPALIPGAASWSITWIQAWGLNVLCALLFKNTNSKKDD
jgi:hypothetical protein